jgi:hypothetical protein
LIGAKPWAKPWAKRKRLLENAFLTGAGVLKEKNGKIF